MSSRIGLDISTKEWCDFARSRPEPDGNSMVRSDVSSPFARDSAGFAGHRPGRRGPARRPAQRRLRPGVEVRAGQRRRRDRPDRRLRARRTAIVRRLVVAQPDAAARLERRTRPDAAGHPAGRGLLPGRPRLVPQDVHTPAVPVRQADLAGVRRRLHGFVGVRQRHPRRATSLRLHGFRRRPDEPRAHRRHAERRRGEGAQPGADQPLVRRFRHLPQRPSRRHRPGARGAARRHGDHT